MSDERPDIVVQYSPDNSTWYSGWKQGYSYIRISADGGDTYYINMYHTGEEEPEIIEQYSATVVNWSTWVSSRDYFVRFSVDNGLSWSGGVRFKDVHVKEQYGENVVIQYSNNGSTWKDNYSKGVKYIRFWLDDGEFCTEKVSYNGTGTAQLAVAFSSDGRMVGTSFSKFYHYFVRFSTDGGLSWSGVIRIRDYEHRYQYSDSKTGSFHDEYTEKDIYTRFTEDNGETWSEPYIFARDNSKPFDHRVPLRDNKVAYKIGSSAYIPTVVGNFGLLQSVSKTRSTCKKYNSGEDFTVDTYTFYCNSVSWDYASWYEEVKRGQLISHRRNESGNGSAGNPWKNLCYALEQIECLFQSTCDKNYKIVVTGTVDYPVGTCKSFRDRGVELHNVGGFPARAGHPLFLDMSGATINYKGEKEIPYALLFNGTFIVIDAKIKVSGVYPIGIGEGSIWNDCSVEMDIPRDSYLFHNFIFGDCECVSCEVEFQRHPGRRDYAATVCFQHCKCADCTASVKHNGTYEDYADTLVSINTYGFLDSWCKKCYADSFYYGFYHQISSSAELEENTAERCYYGFRGVQNCNNCQTINCYRGYMCRNKSVLDSCKAVINNDYKDMFFYDFVYGNLFYAFECLHYEVCVMKNCKVEVSYTLDSEISSGGFDAFFTYDSLLSGCSADILLVTPDKKPYYSFVHITGFSGTDNIMSSCSFNGEFRGEAGILRIKPVSFDRNTIENFSYTCLPRCAVEPE